MTHANDGLLQALLDGEIDSSAAAELRAHLSACAECASELNALQRVGNRAHDALSLVDVAPPMLRAQAAIAAARAGRSGTMRRTGRFAGTGSRSFAKAAMLLLALAGAGAAAIPDSPVRRAVESTIARVAQLFSGPAEQVADAPAAAPATPEPAATTRGGMGVLPANGRVRVVLGIPAGDVDVTVRLVDSPRALVETSTTGQGVRFRSAPGRLEVAGLTTGSITISLPRTASDATVEVAGQVYAYKQGALLQLAGAAGAERAEQVHFRLGT